MGSIPWDTWPNIKLDDVKTGLEELLSEYTKDKDEWYGRYEEMENELRAKDPGITDAAIQQAIYDMDDDIVSYVNIDDIEDKISALERLMKTADADGNDIVQTAEFGVGDTVPQEEFMRDIKAAIKQNNPEVYSKLFMYDIGEAQDTVQDIEEVDEVAESIAKLKAMAGVGSKVRSNHGIHEGEPGYQITPRSIVARQMRKLQDIEKAK